MGIDGPNGTAFDITKKTPAMEKESSTRFKRFKAWLQDNNYGYVTNPMNTIHNKMWEAYKEASNNERLSSRDNLLDK